MKNLIFVLLAALLLAACGNKNEYTLNGEIIPGMDGKVVLHGFENGDPKPMDTTEVVDGSFTFTGELEYPELFLLSIDGRPSYVAQLFLDASVMEAKIYPDSLGANTLTGSESHDLLQVYMDELIRFSNSETELQQRFRQAQIDNDKDEQEAVRYEYETIMENTQLYAKNFINEYNDSPVAAYVYLMNFFQRAPLAELDSMLVVFDELQNTDFYKSIQDRAEVLRVSGVGVEAPDFTLNDPDGNPVSLSSLKGKYVLIDFWASWCQPCMVEMPNVIAQYEKYKDKGFEILGVSLDRTKDDWLRTLEAKEMNWVHVWDMEPGSKGGVTNKYGVTGIPHTVLLDKEGKIIEKNLRGPALAQKLQELMGE